MPATGIRLSTPDYLNPNSVPLVRCNQLVGACCTASLLLASWTVNASSEATRCISLTSWQGPGKVCPIYSKWRLVEASYGTQYASGSVSCQGELVGLPAQFCSSYNYNGYMRLYADCCSNIVYGGGGGGGF